MDVKDAQFPIKVNKAEGISPISKANAQKHYYVAQRDHETSLIRKVLKINTLTIPGFKKHSVWLLSSMCALLLEEQPSSICEEMHSNDMVAVTSKLFPIFCHRPTLRQIPEDWLVNITMYTPWLVNTLNNGAMRPQNRCGHNTYLQNQALNGCHIPSATCPRWSWPQTFRCFQWRSCGQKPQVEEPF